MLPKLIFIVSFMTFYISFLYDLILDTYPFYQLAMTISYSMRLTLFMHQYFKPGVAMIEKLLI